LKLETGAVVQVATANLCHAAGVAGDRLKLQRVPVFHVTTTGLTARASEDLSRLYSAQLVLDRQILNVVRTQQLVEAGHVPIQAPRVRWILHVERRRQLAVLHRKAKG